MATLLAVAVLGAFQVVLWWPLVAMLRNETLTVGFDERSYDGPEWRGSLWSMLRDVLR